MKLYTLGNCLRGYFEGEFETQEEAWKWLSRRFLLSYPSITGRWVQMYVREKNQYKFEQWIMCQDGVTNVDDSIPRQQVLEKCKDSSYA